MQTNDQHNVATPSVSLEGLTLQVADVGGSVRAGRSERRGGSHPNVQSPTGDRQDGNGGAQRGRGWPRQAPGDQDLRPDQDQHQRPQLGQAVNLPAVEVTEVADEEQGADGDQGNRGETSRVV